MVSVDVKHRVPFKLNDCVGHNLLCVRVSLAVNMKKIFENEFFRPSLFARGLFVFCVFLFLFLSVLTLTVSTLLESKSCYHCCVQLSACSVIQ